LRLRYSDGLKQGTFIAQGVLRHPATESGWEIAKRWLRRERRSGMIP
jgi:hypothetical protein